MENPTHFIEVWKGKHGTTFNAQIEDMCWFNILIPSMIYTTIAIFKIKAK